MTEDVQRALRFRDDLEVSVASLVANADPHLVGCWMPEKGDFDAVIRSVSELTNVPLVDAHLLLVE
jgi:hypothetical protein